MAYRILIVDDEPALQRMVREILIQAGYETDSALSCAQARALFSTAAPDATGKRPPTSGWGRRRLTGAKGRSGGAGWRLPSPPKSSRC